MCEKGTDIPKPNENAMNTAMEIHRAAFGDEPCNDDRIDPISIARIVEKNQMLKKPPFDWMKDWLDAYDREHDTERSEEILSWIDQQPMGC